MVVEVFVQSAELGHNCHVTKSESRCSENVRHGWVDAGIVITVFSHHGHSLLSNDLGNVLPASDR